MKKPPQQPPLPSRILPIPRTTNLKALAWHPDLLPDYQSMWLTVHRLLFLNGPCRLSFVKDFCGPNTKLTDQSLNLSEIRVLKLARSLKERAVRFKYSRLADFDGMEKQFISNEFRICPECLADGYHTVFFSLKCLDRCPIHWTKLSSKCFCGRQLRENISAGAFNEPGMCDCGEFQILPPESARVPKIDRASLYVLDDVFQWFSKSKLQIAIGQFNSDLFPLLDIKIDENIQLWTSVSENYVPFLFTLRFEELDKIQKAFIVVYQYARSETADLIARARRFQCIADRRQPDPEWFYFHTYTKATKSPEFIRADLIYRSINRYIYRHLVRRAKHWMVSFTMHSDIDYILPMIQKDETAFYAYAFILFWQKIENFVEMQSWLRRFNGAGRIKYSSMREEYYSFKVTSFIEDLRLDEEDWLRQNLTALFIWAVWKDCVVKAREMASSGEIKWGHGLIVDSSIRQWAAQRGADNRLLLYVHQTWMPTIRPLAPRSKSERQSKWAETHRRVVDCHEKNRLLCGRPRLRKCPDHSWAYGPGTIPDSSVGHQWLRVRRLATPQKKVNYFLFPDAESFVARSIDPPIEVRMRTTKEAVNELCKQVLFYLSDGAQQPQKK